MNRPIRTLFLDRGMTFHGGVSQVLLSLARNLDRDRLEMLVGCLKEPMPAMQARFEAAGVRVEHVGDDGYASPARRLRPLLRRLGVQIVVCNSFKSYLVAKLAVIGTPIRVVYWMHGIDHLSASRVRRELFRRLAVRDSLIFISNAARAENLGAWHRGVAHVILNGVEPPENDEAWMPYPRDARAEFGLPGDARVLGYVASDEPYKDPGTLIEAFGRLAATDARLHLLLIGKAGRLDEHREHASRVPGGDRIHLLGVRPDARRLLGLLDVYVHPAHAEGFGLAVVEAMLAGIPVVCANAGALPELVRSGATGMLVEPRDPEALARGIRQVLDDTPLAERLANAARTHARTEFSPRRFAAEVERVLTLELQTRAERSVARATHRSGS